MAERKSRKKERDLQRMASSEMFQELRSEFSSAPTEVHHGDDIDNGAFHQPCSRVKIRLQLHSGWRGRILESPSLCGQLHSDSCPPACNSCRVLTSACPLQTLPQSCESATRSKRAISYGSEVDASSRCPSPPR